MVQKIQNLDTEVTNDQIEIEWAQVFSTRNKLLEISDWTQLNDVFLTPEAKKQWGMWRQKLRKVNRKTFDDLEQAKNVIDLLKKEMPKNSALNDAEFDEKFANAEITKDKAIYKTIVKEQPIILEEKISLERFDALFRDHLEKDAYAFKQYLLSFLDRSNTNLFLETDVMEECRQKTKNFLAEQQTFSLNRKTKYLPDIRILTQRAEEALEFLTETNPNLEHFPLIRLHSEVMEMTPEESALNFLKQKKWYNQLLLESDKFLLYTTKKIDAAATKTHLLVIIEDIKNGY
jgi:hypothetical protein